MIVAAILAMIAGFGLFAGLDAYRGLSLRSERELIIGLLRKARSQAMNNIDQTGHGVHYDAGTGCRSRHPCYVLFEGSRFDPGGAGNVEIEAGRGAGIGWPGSDPVFKQLDGSAETARISLVARGGSTLITINYEGRIDWQ